MIDISGALYLLKIHEYTQTRYEEGARDVISIWVPVVIKKLYLDANAIFALAGLKTEDSKK